MSAADSRRVPRDQVDSVVKALYAAADRLGWEHMAANARTAQYDDWVSDADIGGVLTQYMSSENARSWIKDGPMKEYARARLGAGRYARFGSVTGPTAKQVVIHALGSEARPISGTVGVKPFHCLATNADDIVYVAWGATQNVRHLVWACISHIADNPTHKACVVILETMEHPITQADKTRQARIGRRCSITFKYLRVTPVRRSKAGEAP